MSDIGLIVVHSHSKVKTGLEDLYKKMTDYDTRGQWDYNFHSGRLVKPIGPDVELHYMKTKKMALVSPRDQYILIASRNISA